MLRTLFYGLTHGVVSGRKLAEVCRNDNRFIVLSGNLQPDRRTLDRFIRRHQERFSELFVQVVRLAQKMDLVSLGRVALDGSKFKAAANQDMAYSKMKRAIGHIEENLKALKDDLAQANAEESTELEERLSQEIQDQNIRRDRIAKAKKAVEQDFAKRTKRGSAGRMNQARKALVDPDALSLSYRGGGFMHGYNLQAAVDEKTQIVVASDIHDSAADYGALPRLVDQVATNCGKHANAYLADAGYHSLENLKKLKDVDATPVICRRTARTNLATDEAMSEQVTSGSQAREYFCKAGRRLDLMCRSKKSNTLIFKMAPGFCDGCSFQATCHLFGKKHPAVLDDDDRHLYNSYLALSRTSAWQEAYRQRKAIVEPIFGNLKHNKCMKIFVRGRKAVHAWCKMVTTAHNIEKIIRQLAKGPRPITPSHLLTLEPAF